MTLPHAYTKTSLAIALLSGIASSAIGAGTANALTLMDMLRGEKRQSVQEQVEGRVPTSVQPPISQRAIDLSDPEPLPKVSAPKYFTYKADAFRAVKTAGFATASATDASRFLAQAKVSAPSDVANAVEAFYAKNAALLWVDKEDVSERARAVIALMEKAGDYGLNPADYRIPVPTFVTSSVSDAQKPVEAPAVTPVSADASSVPTPAAESPAATAVKPAVAQAPDEHQKELMQFELALSAKAVLFAQDMARGRIDPNRISEYHDLKRRDVNLSSILPGLQSAADASVYLDGMAPKSAQFLALKAELAKVRAAAGNEAQAVQVPETLKLKPGESNADLAKVIAAIQHKGSDALKTQHSAVFASYQNTPTYAPELVEVVKSFQKEIGLKADGVIGPATVRAMTGHTSDDKIEKLIVAMEQSKWLPDDLGSRYVFINQPAFRVYYHQNGQEQFSMRVVVGSPSHQTFFFQDEIQTVELNPYWGVPQSIIINEMLPKLRQDPSYLDRMGYQVEVSGKAVSSTAVDWRGSTQAISVRQPPSSDNALGELKILFPNAHAIYMHDTPQKSFFQRDMRALSHGCVRLAEPRKMAAAVLGITEQDLAGKIAQGKNQAIQVPQKFPVYVAYFTAWPNKDGHIEYFDDIYKRDVAVEKAFEITSKARGA
ncbi:L,D-transpeptidase family protein [Rhizobium rhizoryzae]|uniref:Murein L,D-transpeptidase YcbB/YkuD n=1 Tax=Rhizobium rhizoryzae TaxID=451876 RepID=A0A7W6LEX2_9HYPH|nr:L,D-transpeptidase family protein [Rhizobium rhizoryzae]MBB4141952.1 murein L,D-transpeptidase YcbB/YkuD [Rhizobium rhizoryzae]